MLRGFAFKTLKDLLRSPRYCLLQSCYVSNYKQLSVVKPGHLLLTVNTGIKGTVNILPADLSKDLTSYSFKVSNNGFESNEISLHVKEESSRNSIYLTIPDACSNGSSTDSWDIAIPHHYGRFQTFCRRNSYTQKIHCVPLTSCIHSH